MPHLSQVATLVEVKVKHFFASMSTSHTISVAVGRDTTSANTANEQLSRPTSAEGCVSSTNLAERKKFSLEEIRGGSVRREETWTRCLGLAGWTDVHRGFLR